MIYLRITHAMEQTRWKVTLTITKHHRFFLFSRGILVSSFSFIFGSSLFSLSFVLGHFISSIITLIVAASHMSAFGSIFFLLESVYLAEMITELYDVYLSWPKSECVQISHQRSQMGIEFIIRFPMKCFGVLWINIKLLHYCGVLNIEMQTVQYNSW